MFTDCMVPVPQSLHFCMIAVADASAPQATAPTHMPSCGATQRSCWRAFQTLAHHFQAFCRQERLLLLVCSNAPVMVHALVPHQEQTPLLWHKAEQPLPSQASVPL